MIPCEHFLIGYFKNKGFVTFKSDKVDEIVNQDDMRDLLQQGGRIKQATLIAKSLCRSRLIAISYLKPTVDEMGRPGLWQHTILIPCGQLVTNLKLIEKLNGVFIREEQALRNPLAPVNIELEGP